MASAHKIGGALYVVWGLLHIYAAYNVYSLAAGFEDAGLAARMAQAGWNLGIIALISIAIGAKLNWHNDRVGYWLNLAMVSLADIGFIVLLLLPGHFPMGKGLIGPAFWVAAAVFSTIGIRQTTD